jgi:hypothetical protein
MNHWPPTREAASDGDVIISRAELRELAFGALSNEARIRHLHFENEDLRDQNIKLRLRK